MLVALGLGFVTYKGADVAVLWVFSYVKNTFNVLDGQTLSFIAWLWVDKAVSMLFSAFTTALAIKTLASGLTALKAKA